jgi:murein DD-endopeptidase MepM/ murein hydrolase activator NlpD
MATAKAARVWFVALALTTALSGCGEGIHGLRKDMGWDQTQPASQQGYSRPSPQQSASTETAASWQNNPADSSPIAPGQGPYVVQRGDTLYSIARRSGVPVRQVIDANGLQAPYQLQVGQRVTLPSLNTYTVAAGETLYSVSRKTRVEMSEIVRANQLEPPYAIRSGQVLVLPSAGQGGNATTVTAAPPPVASSGVAAQPLDSGPPPSSPSGISAAPLAPPLGLAGSQLPGAPVGTGAPAPVTPSTSSAVAAAPSTSAWVPVAPPASVTPTTPVAPPAQPTPAPPSTALPPPVTLAAPPAAASSVGAQSLPPPGGVVPSASTVPTPPAAAPIAPLPAAPASPPAAASEAPPAATQQASAAPPVLKELTAPPPRGGKSFLWPVKGRLIATFGEQAKGLHNDGINIGAARGTTVVAAENGVVAYAGNELRGFGNLLLIRHADGFMTAYAHNDELLVQRGDTVRRGQAIAKLGSTGSVAEPQLHFEVRKSGQPVDPEKYLAPPGDALLILWPFQSRQRDLG